MSVRIPVTIVTGFLGAGKTSLLRHLVEHAAGRRIALLINEFGELGIDGEILRGCGIEGCREEDVLELANGCICCTVADDFLPAMRALLSRRPPPDHILIETSGLALPKPLVKAFTWPEVRSRATVDGVLAVVDGAAVAAGLFASDPEALEMARRADPSLDHETPLEELFEEQLACADLVLLTKMDLVAPGRTQEVRQRVAAEIRPGVPVLAASFGRVDPRIALGLGAGAEDDLDSRPSHHDGGEPHEHDEFESLVLELPPLTDRDRLVGAVASLATDFPVYRVKGFAAFADLPMRLVLQAVGSRVESYFDRPWRNDEIRRTRLVAIGERGLDAAALHRHLRSALEN